MKLLSDKLSFIRFYTWWNYKLPPLFGIAYFYTLLKDVPFDVALTRYGVLLISMIGTAGFGHYLNDLADIEADRAAGKTNAAALHSPVQRIALIIILLALSLLPWVLLHKVGAPLYFVMGILVLFVLYSLPPVRLKSRAFAGVLADMLYAHGVPALIVAFAMLDEVVWGDSQIALIFFWQVLVGLRNIAFHQVEDVEADRIAGVKTWATQLGAESIKKICLWFFHPLELLAFAFIVVNIFQHTLLGGIILLTLIVWRLVVYLFIYDRNYMRNLGNYFSFVNNSNEEDLPVALLMCLCAADPWFIVVFALHMVLFPQFAIRLTRL